MIGGLRRGRVVVDAGAEAVWGFDDVDEGAAKGEDEDPPRDGDRVTDY